MSNNNDIWQYVPRIKVPFTKGIIISTLSKWKYKKCCDDMQDYIDERIIRYSADDQDNPTEFFAISEPVNIPLYYCPFCGHSLVEVQPQL